MAKGKILDSTTEARVKEAARAVFIRKGYAATRTRDIAEEAGINLAMLNYYFRSKERLFEIIMFETMFGFMQKMALVFNDEKTTIRQKVEVMIDTYTDTLIKEPNIPLFIMSEIRNDAIGFLEKLPVDKMVVSSYLVKQYKEAYNKGLVKEPNPLNFIINLMSLVQFPFIASPLIKKMGGLSDKQFNDFMQERKRTTIELINTMIK